MRKYVYRPSSGKEIKTTDFEVNFWRPEIEKMTGIILIIFNIIVYWRWP